MRRASLVAIVLAATAAACAGPNTTSAPSQVATATPTGEPSAAAIELQVYAAASLKRALARATEAYGADNPAVTITASTDSSSALETKIEQGAPANLFLSADIGNPQRLAESGLAAGEITPFAASLLTVIVPEGNPAAIESPADLAKPGVKVIAAGPKVPITRYATQLIQNLAGVPGYPADFDEAYAANVVSQEDNVAGIVGKIELGEGDAGIVYVSDAKGSGKVEHVEVPTSANVPATYAGIVVKGSADEEAAARAFLDWLAGPDGQAILAEFGFLPITS
jgi:molybdate transport system substrate-binding protein